MSQTLFFHIFIQKCHLGLFRLCTQGEFKMWEESLETSGVWSQELTSTGKKSKHCSPAVLHRDFLTGVCWPCWAASCMFPDYAAPVSIFQSQFSLDCWNAMTSWQITFTAIIWAGTEGWSPHVRDWACRDQEKKRHCLHGCSARKCGGKSLRRLRFTRPLVHFKQRFCSFVTWCQIHKHAFNF